MITCNIQSWDMNERRKKGIIDLIVRHNPDIICFQEVTISWFSLLKKELGHVYNFTGRDRYYGDRAMLKRDHERNCILFKKDRFTLLSGHTYWMGPDMKHPSKYDNSVFNRIFSVANLLDNKTNQKFQCISTHLDYDLVEGREKQAIVLANYLKKQKLPLVLAGDFNSEPKEPAYKLISSILTDVAKEFGKTDITYHAYDKFPHERIDYIFRNKEIYPKRCYLVNDEYEGLPPSDHYQVECIFEIK